MLNRDPEKNFEEFWKTFNNRYPFFEIRNVDWQKQHETYRPRVTSQTCDEELFEIFCQMLEPLNDGHVSLIAQTSGKRKQTLHAREEAEILAGIHRQQRTKQLFETTGKTLVANGFGPPQQTEAWMLRYCRSQAFGYIRIIELEGINEADSNRRFGQGRT